MDIMELLTRWGTLISGDDDGTAGSFSGWEDMTEEQFRMFAATVE